MSEVTDSFILKKAFGSLCSLTVLEVSWKDIFCFAQGADATACYLVDRRCGGYIFLMPLVVRRVFVVLLDFGGACEKHVNEMHEFDDRSHNATRLRLLKALDVGVGRYRQLILS